MNMRVAHQPKTCARKNSQPNWAAFEELSLSIDPFSTTFSSRQGARVSLFLAEILVRSTRVSCVLTEADSSFSAVAREDEGGRKTLGLRRETNKIEWRAIVDEDSLVEQDETLRQEIEFAEVSLSCHTVLLTRVMENSFAI